MPANARYLNDSLKSMPIVVVQQIKGGRLKKRQAN